ncbi:unnamed protein product, partial [Lampetra planeri]
MDTESQFSGYSYSSGYSRGSRHQRDRNRHKHRGREGSGRGDKSVTIHMPSGGGGALKDCWGKGCERDDNWGETTTVVTGTSEQSTSREDFAALFREPPAPEGRGGCAGRHAGRAASALLGALALLSPVAFLAIPHALWRDELQPCGTACEGLFLSLAFKLLALAVGTWALFARGPRHALPRVRALRALVLALGFLLLLAFWLFFGARILASRDPRLPWHRAVRALARRLSALPALPGAGAARAAPAAARVRRQGGARHRRGEPSLQPRAAQHTERERVRAGELLPRLLRLQPRAAQGAQVARPQAPHRLQGVRRGRQPEQQRGGAVAGDDRGGCEETRLGPQRALLRGDGERAAHAQAARAAGGGGGGGVHARAAPAGRGAACRHGPHYGPAGGGAGHLPLDGASPAEVSPRHQAAALPQHGGHPQAPGPLHRTRHDGTGLPGEVPEPGPHGAVRAGQVAELPVAPAERRACDVGAARRHRLLAGARRPLPRGDGVTSTTLHPLRDLPRPQVAQVRAAPAVGDLRV